MVEPVSTHYDAKHFREPTLTVVGDRIHIHMVGKVGWLQAKTSHVWPVRADQAQGLLDQIRAAYYADWNGEQGALNTCISKMTALGIDSFTLNLGTSDTGPR